MREILFRGKVKYNGNHFFSGEWVYGSYRYDNVNEIHCVWSYEEDDYGNVTRNEEAEVIPETVGQYTGMVDKKGNKIFEGDIFKDDDEDELTLHCVFKDGAFCVEIQGAKGVLMEHGYDEYAGNYEVIECENISYYDGYLEIIGNIHDEVETNVL